MLGAGDRDDDLSMCCYKNGCVKYPILLCSREFLPVQEKDCFFTFVDYLEFGTVPPSLTSVNRNEPLSMASFRMIYSGPWLVSERAGIRLYSCKSGDHPG